ncbi:Uncharacterised protein [Kluyvera cryocrescens]|uniref:Uncharacterized protein n=1 Tax=Kluyvera cryocrescens TaxID=580 RepID=A0A485AWC3_KLUCR|nr:Uncharacterised protein [Kluyvera cryocrescens]
MIIPTIIMDYVLLFSPHVWPIAPHSAEQRPAATGKSRIRRGFPEPHHRSAPVRLSISARSLSAIHHSPNRLGRTVSQQCAGSVKQFSRALGVLLRSRVLFSHRQIPPWLSALHESAVDRCATRPAPVGRGRAFACREGINVPIPAAQSAHQGIR